MKILRGLAYLCLVGSSLLFSTIAKAQQDFESEEELRNEARRLFDEGRYETASPLYSSLLSLYPTDPELNFRYGACLVYAGADMDKALRYLQYAEKNQTEFPEIKFFIARAYHLSYRFTDAEHAYMAFQERASSRLKNQYPSARELDMVRYGRELINSSNDLVVLDKKEVSSSEFFRSYSLGDFGGKLIVKPEEFMLSHDRKSKDRTVMFLQDNAERIFFSSYGSNGKNGKDIYYVFKMANGGWSEPQPLGNPVNTPHDEDYPFLHPNGNVLYFSSNGHNSMGGYDIFRSEFDPMKNTWSEPVNMEFPLNTPADEYLYITDAADSVACFASNRSSKGEKIHIYKIRNEKVNAGNLMVVGKFKKPETSAQDVSAKVTVISATSNRNAGSYRTHEKSGEYLLYLPGPGSYRFIVEVPGYPPQSGNVEIPYLGNQKTLKQEMELVSANTGPKLLIRNLFDEQISDMELALIRELTAGNRAALEVNADRFTDSAPSQNVENVAENGSEGQKPESEIADADPVTESGKTIQNNTTGKLSDEEILAIANEGVDSLKAEAVQLKEEADYALAFAATKTEKAREKKQEADQLQAGIAAIKDPEEKEQTSSKVKELQAESDRLAREALIAYRIALKIEQESKQKEKDAEQNETYAEELKRAVEEDNEEKAIQLLEAQRESIKASNDTATGSRAMLTSLQQKAETRKTQAGSYRRKQMQLEEQLAGLEEEINNLRSEASRTRDEQLKENLLSQAVDTEAEIQAVSKQLDGIRNTATMLENEGAGFERDMQLLAAMMDERQDDQATAPEFTESQRELLKSQVSSIQVSDTPPPIQATGSQEVSAISADKESAPTDEPVREDNPSDAGQSTEETPAGTALASTGDIPEGSEQRRDVNTETAEQVSASSAVNSAEVTSGAEVQKAQAEVAQLETRAAEYRRQAMQAVLPDERTALFEKAAEADKEVWEKRAEVYQAGSRENQSAFIRRESMLNQVASNGVSDPAQEEVALLLREEAQSYFNQARALNTGADTITNALDRISTLERAARLEELALERQQAAYKIYAGTSDFPDSAPIAGLPVESVTSTPANVEADYPADLPAADSENSGQDNTSVIVNTPDENQQAQISAEDRPAGVSTPAQNPATEVAPETPVTVIVQHAEIYDQVLRTAGAEADSLNARAEILRFRADSIALLIESARKKDKPLLEEHYRMADRYALEAEEEAQSAQARHAVLAGGNQENVVIPADPQEVMALPHYLVYEEILDQASEAASSAAMDSARAVVLFRDATNADATMRRMRSENPEIVDSREYLQLKSVRDESQLDGDSLYLNAARQIRRSDSIQLVAVNYLQGLPDELATALHHAAGTDQDIEITPLSPQTRLATTTPADPDLTLRGESISSETETPVQAGSSEENLADAVAQQDSGGTQPSQALEPATETTQNTNTPSSTEPAEPLAVSIQPAPAPAAVYSTAYKAPRKLGQPIFERTSGAVYDASNPIPMDVEMPEGLVFKVQIGAFRNPVPPEHFTGFAPLTGERTNQGFTRYTAGYFNDYSPAIAARNEIRTRGYRDAFVVAYLNGKRIPYNQAVAMLDQNRQDHVSAVSTELPVTGTNQQPLNNNTQGNITEGGSAVTGGQAQPGNLPVVSADPEAPLPSSTITSLQGVIFTVQVGVYSQPVKGGQLRFLQPLYSEETANGLIRYTAGAYSTAERAVQAKSIINQNGISDAFVSAYINGRRVSLAEARNALNNGAQVSPSPVLDNMPWFGAATGTTPVTSVSTATEQAEPLRTPADVSIGDNPQDESPVQPTGPAPVSGTADGLVFRVQVGAFREEVPNDMAVKFIAISSKGINHYRNEEGFTIYSAGSFKQYEEASALKDELSASYGLSDAFVVAYLNGERIDIERAFEILKGSGE